MPSGKSVQGAGPMGGGGQHPENRVGLGELQKVRLENKLHEGKQLIQENGQSERAMQRENEGLTH